MSSKPKHRHFLELIDTTILVWPLYELSWKKNHRSYHNKITNYTLTCSQQQIPLFVQETIAIQQVPEWSHHDHQLLDNLLHPCLLNHAQDCK